MVFRLSTIRYREYQQGFTLAELLIALLILSVIATFTIPKVIVAQNSARFNAIAKEAISAAVQAVQMHQMNGALTSTSRIEDFTNYLNYVRVDTTSTIDDRQTQGTLGCGASSHAACLVLHNGAYLYYSGAQLGAMTNLNTFSFWIDPDGKVTDPTTNGPGKALMFFVYSDLKVRTRGTVELNSVNGSSSWPTPQPTHDPPWFSW